MLVKLATGANYIHILLTSSVFVNRCLAQLLRAFILGLYFGGGIGYWWKCPLQNVGEINHRYKFHQHFRNSFYVLIVWFCNSLAKGNELVKLLIKCWWNWLLVHVSSLTVFLNDVTYFRFNQNWIIFNLLRIFLLVQLYEILLFGLIRVRFRDAINFFLLLMYVYSIISQNFKAVFTLMFPVAMGF